MIVLMHCNKFYGRILKGCKKVYLQKLIPPSLRGRGSFSIKVGRCCVNNSSSSISSYATTTSVPGPVLPCCSNGPLDREMTFVEYNFLDVHPGEWTLYRTKDIHSKKRYGRNHHHHRCWPTVNRHIQQFILVPQDQYFDSSDLSAWTEWQYVGVCRAGVMRMDLHYHLQQEQVMYHTDHCTHIEIFIDRLFDRQWRHRLHIGARECRT